MIRDHRHIERVLAALESLLDSKQKGRNWDVADSRALEVLTGALSREQCRHMRKEDEVLFPFLEKFLPGDSGPLMVLRGEHQDLSGGLRNVVQAGGLLLQDGHASQASRDLQCFGRKTIQGFRDHIYKEDRVLFPMVERFLSPDQDLPLLRRMENIQCGG